MINVQAAKLGGTAYYRNTISAALGTIVAPAANTKGIRVRYACVKSYSDVTRLMAKAAAPANITEGVEILSAVVSTAGTNINAVLQNEKIIPPGLGLYEQSANVVQESFVSVDYEVLA